MGAEADVLRLVQRADWTRLSLAAEVNDGSRLLLAPGRRYREQTRPAAAAAKASKASAAATASAPGGWLRPTKTRTCTGSKDPSRRCPCCCARAGC
jgi:hypothetical protein